MIKTPTFRQLVSEARNTNPRSHSEFVDRLKKARLANFEQEQYDRLSTNLDKFGRPIIVGNLVWLNVFERKLRHTGVTRMLGRIINFEYSNYDIGNRAFIDIGGHLPERYRNCDTIELAVGKEQEFAAQLDKYAESLTLSILEDLIV
jgi:hypothetical protein